MIERCATVIVVWHPFHGECSCLFAIASVCEWSYSIFRLLVFRPYVDEYSRQHVEHLHALELSDCDALNTVYEVLGFARDATEWLEGEQIPTGSHALKYLWWFVCIMTQRSPTNPIAVLNSRQYIVVPLARVMKEKLMHELDDPNWVFAMAFIAYMDPSCE